jgi:NAD(P)-dependent dehydrogenase (short-subunit alcohol dehydrogenase family)
LLGILLSMKHELRVMLAQGSGSIVNVSSTYGHGGAAYAACGDQTGGWRQEKGRAS